MIEKPFHGRIKDWARLRSTDRGLGYLIIGEFLDHPKFAGKQGHTSYIVKHDEETGEIETRNSRYLLVGPEQRAWPHERRAHVDDVVEDEAYPDCLRTFLRYHRLPACLKAPGEDREKIKKYVLEEEWPYIWTDPAPRCFADYNGYRVRLTMASRLGDVGISPMLEGNSGYRERVSLADLSNFGDAP